MSAVPKTGVALPRGGCIQKHIAAIRGLETSRPDVFASLKSEWQKHSPASGPASAAAGSAARPRPPGIAGARPDGLAAPRAHAHASAPRPAAVPPGGGTATTAAPQEEWFRPNTSAPPQEQWFHPSAVPVNGRGGARPTKQAGGGALQWQHASMKRPARGPRPPAGADHGGLAGPHGPSRGGSLPRASSGPGPGRGRSMRRV